MGYALLVLEFNVKFQLPRRILYTTRKMILILNDFYKKLF